ncbi:MAG: TrbI/VirB10 family protein [Verrucomicrobiota bacterium]|nr:TrbI/VirB10 family protein [Verrucomicrobiota bacterium]
MNPRAAVNFVKTPTGAFLGFCFFLIVGFLVFRTVHKPPQTKRTRVVADAAGTAPQAQVVESSENKNFSPLKIPFVKEEKEPATESHKSDRQTVDIPPISLFAETPEPPKKELSKFYAPYGRLIPCELIITVDSSSIRTPIVGLVTDDIYHAGRLIIPAGTEVHGSAQVDRTRERIASADRWTLVWQSGEELRLGGIALDREKDASSEGWGITDGSAGLRGRLVKSDDMAEIKLFAATFLSGAASSLTDREQTIFGSITSPTLRNAPLKGAQDVLGTYAKQIYDSIQRDGFYVRVPAGKQFYLYVTQTIDNAEATVGGTILDDTDQRPATNQLSSASAAQAVTPHPIFIQPGAMP